MDNGEGKKKSSLDDLLAEVRHIDGMADLVSLMSVPLRNVSYPKTLNFYATNLLALGGSLLFVLVVRWMAGNGQAELISQLSVIVKQNYQLMAAFIALFAVIVVGHAIFTNKLADEHIRKWPHKAFGLFIVLWIYTLFCAMLVSLPLNLIDSDTMAVDEFQNLANSFNIYFENVYKAFSNFCVILGIILLTIRSIVGMSHIKLVPFSEFNFQISYTGGLTQALKDFSLMIIMGIAISFIFYKSVLFEFSL